MVRCESSLQRLVPCMGEKVCQTLTNSDPAAAHTSTQGAELDRWTDVVFGMEQNS